MVIQRCQRDYQNCRQFSFSFAFRKPNSSKLLTKKSFRNAEKLLEATSWLPSKWIVLAFSMIPLWLSLVNKGFRFTPLEGYATKLYYNLIDCRIWSCSEVFVQCVRVYLMIHLSISYKVWFLHRKSDAHFIISFSQNNKKGASFPSNRLESKKGWHFEK